MPFFQDIEQASPSLPYAAKQDTLQVRKPREQKDEKKPYLEKRVWPFASVDEREAAVSVEAALALSIFIFAMVCMMIPFRMMERQRQVQAALESVNEDLCQYAYLEHMLSGGEEIPKEDGDWKKELLLGLINGAAGAGAQFRAEEMFSQEGMASHSFSRSAFLEDGETVRFCMDYEMRMPFSIIGLDEIAFSSQSARRAWIGRDGLEREGGGSQEEDDPIVYIGKTSTRYHRSRDCHYLSNKLKVLTYDEVGGYRNQGGGRYYPCAVCGGSAQTGSLVYIMESGARYHTDKDCAAIIAYVQEVRLSEVEHMGGCSYCCR